MKWPEDYLDRIICGDCRDILKGIPEKAAHLVLTDPPYNVGIDYGGGFDDKKEDFLGWMAERFFEMRRASQTVLITGPARLPDYAIIEPWKWLLAWWKPAAMGRSPVGFCNWEPVAMWGRGSSAGKADVVRAPIIPEVDLEGHPCPKPLAWALGFLRLFPAAALVLDPFAGSGTTCVAAKMLGRRYIGIDINPDYCRLARERLQAAETGVGVGERRQGQGGLFE